MYITKSIKEVCIKNLIILLAIVAPVIAYSQTGPGGVGNATGADGQPELKLWLIPDSLSLTDGNDVDTLSDHSGNANDLTQDNSSYTPIFRENEGSINDHDYLEFSKANNRIVRNPFDMPTSAVAVFMVLKTGDSDEGLLSYNAAGADNEYLFLKSNDHNTYIGGNKKDLNVSYNDNSWKIFAHQWRNTDGRLYLHINGTAKATKTHRPTYIITENGSLAIGGEQDGVNSGYEDHQAFQGDIAEIIMYGSSLLQADRVVIENYLAQKYGLDANLTVDRFDPPDALYIDDMSGVGKEADGVNELNSAGFVVTENGNFDIGDYIFAAHDGTENSINTTHGMVHGEVEAAWERNWYLEKSGAGAGDGDVDAKIAFDLGEGIDGDYPSNIENYRLLHKTNLSDDYDTITSESHGIQNGDQIYFAVINAEFSDGYYTLGTVDQTNSPLVGMPARTWYTLISGDWDHWETWTLDPSGALPNNPDEDTPMDAPIDRVVILSGRSITVNENNLENAYLKIDGELNLQAYTGHSFSEIEGSGRLVLANDNFPAGDATHFTSAGQGEGTVVYTGGTYDLTKALSFYNLNIELDNETDTLTLLADYDIAGDFMVDTGAFQINNGSGTDLNIELLGDASISAAGKILTGGGDARHQFDFYGDLTNNGILEFTNRSSADYNNEASDGIVDANFLNGSKNQTILCNNTSNFYRIEIDKGTDKTYELKILADDEAYFNLYGYANQSHDEVPQLDDDASSANQRNPNALGLYRGTVRLGNNVDVPVLNNVVNYNISEAARLWIDGGSAAKTDGTAIVPYGEILVSGGELESFVSSGITTRKNGLIKVEGGTLNTNVIRTSVFGPSNVGGYVQSGGTVNIVNPNSATNNYYHFSMTYSGNVFNMSGGTLHVYDASGTATGEGGIFIASDPENINVTGGTVIAEIASTTNPFKITSTAPFYNLILRNTYNSVTDHILDEGTNINGNATADLAAQPLVVLNDFTIEDDVFFDHDGNDVSIGRNFAIDANAQTQTFDVSGMNDTQNDYNIGYLFDPAISNTTTFNGSENGEFYIGYNNSDGFEEFFHNITINKEVGSSVTVVCDTKKTAQYQDDNSLNHWHARLLRVENELKVESGILNQGQSAIRLFGPMTILEDGECGVWEEGTTHPWAWLMLKDADLNISTETGAIMGNVKMNPNPTTDIINFTSDVYIKRIGYFHGRINLQNHELKLDYLHDRLTENNYNISAGSATNEMFYSTGAASDGGLLLYVPAATPDGTDFPFPLGVSGKYTPAEVRLSNVVDDGYISIRPVDGELQTTDLSAGDLLNYYWKVDYEGFTDLPTIDRIRFEYNDSDIVGNENNYVAGKVLNIYPFEREYEDDDVPESEGVDAGNNRITFNGQTDAGFTLEKASYTAGVTGRFSGSPEIFYVRTNGNWNSGNTWSYIRDGDAAGDYPQAGDIAIMRRVSGSGSVTIQNAQNAAAVIYDDENGYSSGYPRIIFSTNNNYAAYDSYFQVVDVADSHEGGTLNYNRHGAVIQYNINDDYSNANSSLQFDGNDDHIAIQTYNYTAAQTAVTVEAWIKTSNSGDQIIASYDRNEYWRLEVNGNGAGNGQIGFDLMTDGGQLDFGGSTRIDDGAWHHVAAVYDNGNVYIYVDGNLDNSTSSGSTFGSGSTTRFGFIGVGSEADVFNGTTGPTDYFDGNISEFRVWNIARSQADIQSTMNSALAGSEPGLVMYHKLDGSGSDATATDYSSNGYDGDLQNFNLPGPWQTIHPWGSAFPGGDFGGFNDYPNALVIYGWDGATANADVTLSAQANEYPQMWFEGGNNSRKLRFPNTDMTIHGGFTIPGDVIIVANGESANTITMEQNMNVGHSTCCGYQGQFLFPGNDPGTVTLDVKKDLNIRGQAAPNSILGIENAAGGTTIHKLKVEGDINIKDEGGRIQLGDGDLGKSNVELELTGSGDNSLTNVSTVDPQFYRIIMNKGSDATSTFTFNSNFSLTGATDGVDVEKAIELQNGKLVLNNASINVDLTTGDDDFYIPGTAGLEVRQGQANANGGSGIILDGKLQVSGGTVDMSGGDNYIQYSATGNATIEVSDGSLTVGSQIRRGLTATEGILKYNQTGGVVIVGTDEAPEDNRGVLEVVNDDSEFNLTGGKLVIARAQTNPEIASLYLDPKNYNLEDDGKIQMGYSTTPSNQEMGIYSMIDIPYLKVDNSSGQMPTVKQWVVPLTIGDSLVVDAGAEFNADGRDLFIKGDMVVNGTFTPNGNTTDFNGSAQQEITGSPAFYNLTKSTATTLALNDDVTINNVFSMPSGTLVDNDNTFSVKGNIDFGGTHTYGGSGNGIVLNGGSEQIMTGAGTYGLLAIDNAEGVSIEQGSNSDITITDELQLNEGIFDIDQYLLTLQTTAEITTTSAFDANSLVQTNISFTDAGIKKDFPKILSTTDFIFPVGVEGKYTPVEFTINSVDAGGSIRIKAANEPQPTIQEDDDETCEFVDIDNVLQYHWILEATSISNFTADMTMKYDPSDTAYDNECGYDDSDYIAARILTYGTGVNENKWNKYDYSNVDESNNQLTFSFSSTDDVGISGDYTAGIEQRAPHVNGAIPNEVTEYITVNPNNSWTEPTDWAVYDSENGTQGTAGVDVPAGGPRGAIIFVAETHTLTIPDNYISAYKTRIEADATLDVGTTIGHRLGIVTGTGTLYLENGALPAGIYDEFFSSSGGTIEFGSNDSYPISITEVNNIVFSGNGGSNWKEFPNNTVTINGDFTIDGGAPYQKGSDELYLHGDLIFNSGYFRFGYYIKNIVHFIGSEDQFITGELTTENTRAFSNVVVNKPSGELTISDHVLIERTLSLQNGIVNTGASNAVFLKNSSENYTGLTITTEGSSASYVNGPLYKELNGSTNFTFPIGKNGHYRPIGIVGPTKTAQWTAEYSTSHNYSDMSSELAQVSSVDFWSLNNVGGGKANITLTWGANTGVVEGLEDSIVVATLDGSDVWQSKGRADTCNTGSSSGGTVTSDDQISFSEKFFTLGSISTNNQLPIELLSFNVEKEGAKALIKWTTGSELNNDYFVIERSKNGRDFEQVTTVSAAGNSNQAINYHTYDYKPLEGLSYYRLKQVDFNGEYTYSEMIPLDNIIVKGKEKKMSVFPNPLTQSELNIHLAGFGNNEQVEVLFMDSYGRIVYSRKVNTMYRDQVYIKLDLTGKLDKGIYLLNVISEDDSRLYKKIIVN